MVPSVLYSVEEEELCKPKNKGKFLRCKVG